MSLDQEGLGEKPRKKRERGDYAEVTRLDLKQRELDHHYETAETKRRMGLPMSDKDRHALKSHQVMSGLQQELQQEQSKRRPIIERKKKVKSE